MFIKKFHTNDIFIKNGFEYPDKCRLN